MIYNNVLEAIGKTPIIRLNKLTDENSAEILVKYDGYLKHKDFQYRRKH